MDYHHGSRADGIDGSNDDVGVWQQPVNIVVALEIFKIHELGDPWAWAH